MLATRSTAATVARAALIVVSVGVAGYLVVDAQRSRPSDPKPAVEDRPEAPPPDAAASGEGSAPTSATVGDEVLDVAADATQPAQDPPPSFMGSSKTLNWSSDPTSTSPVFLPSSKTRLSGELLRPELTPMTPPETEKHEP